MHNIKFIALMFYIFFSDAFPNNNYQEYLKKIKIILKEIIIKEITIKIIINKYSTSIKWISEGTMHITYTYSLLNR